LEFEKRQVARENRQISGKYRGLLKFFLEFEKWQVTRKIDQSQGNMKTC
jgi:hypothetical protein